MSQLRAFIERVERLEEEISGLNKDKAEVYAEAKGAGRDVPTIKKIVRLRKMDYHARLEADALLDQYTAELGMLPDEPRAPARAREIIEEFDAETGEISEGEGREDGAAEGGSPSTLGSATAAPNTGGDHADGASESGAPIHEPQPLAAQTDQGSEPARFIAADGDAVETSAPVQPGTPAVALAAEAPLASAASGEGRLSDGESLSANELSAPIQPETANEAPERPARHPADPLRSEAAAREDADTAAPVTEPSTGTPAGEAVATAVASPVSNVTPLRSATGLERMPGCQHVDACAGKWNARCGTCEAAWNAAAAHDEAATG